MASTVTLSLILSLLVSSISPLLADYYSNKKVMNVIDSCWRGKAYWSANNRALADCAVGLGKNAIGGKKGATYVVTNPSDDPANPKLGTLR
ncbi:Hypothetical predicted protein, partial [Olea europaea subsp. europaea]